MSDQAEGQRTVSLPLPTVYIGLQGDRTESPTALLTVHALEVLYGLAAQAPAPPAGSEPADLLGSVAMALALFRQQQAGSPGGLVA